MHNKNYFITIINITVSALLSYAATHMILKLTGYSVISTLNINGFTEIDSHATSYSLLKICFIFIFVMNMIFIILLYFKRNYARTDINNYLVTAISVGVILVVYLVTIFFGINIYSKRFVIVLLTNTILFIFIYYIVNSYFMSYPCNIHIFIKELYNSTKYLIVVVLFICSVHIVFFIVNKLISPLDLQVNSIKKQVAEQAEYIDAIRLEIESKMKYNINSERNDAINNKHIIKSIRYNSDIKSVQNDCGNIESCWKVEDIQKGTEYRRIIDNQSNMLMIISQPHKNNSLINALPKYIDSPTSLESVVVNGDYTLFTNTWHIDTDWRNNEKNIYYSLSAWVWSDTELSTMLMLKSNTENIGVSAFHNGGRKWEYITVVYPYDDNPEYFEVSLLNRNGTALFRDVTGLALGDNRFQGVSVSRGGGFSERLYPNEGKRKRIMLVGGSSIQGYGAFNRTVSIILQSKLETIYPGKYEVINYGMGGYRLEGDLISYDTDKMFNDTLLRLFRYNPLFASIQQDFIYEPSIKSLKPDYIILSITPFHSSWAINCLDTCAIFNGYNNCNASLDALLKYKTYPTVSNYYALKQTYLSALECSNKYDERIKIDESSRAHNIDSVALNKYYDLYSGTYTAIWYLVTSIANIFGQHSDVYAITMPINSYMIRINPDSKNYSYYNTYLYESNVYSKVCRELNTKGIIGCLDIHQDFQRKYSSLDYNKYVETGYFFDNAHFSYRGNEYIADTIFSYLKAQL
ncbi:hypothetical protein [Candidatus Magnetominusculus xianensis]|uniref:SGNH/GDSL hydrolase family protein n=1 Tax=Candidatus Magnetominusculus xianensis TaxID=1748249 RepID=A0ABR5SG56_9BACT|nr:hypothetical protein [Candidatus Magnetominusculus xianensis]KWT84961.1 hypothetical protein ASN18_1891 [Candidatus Magnetominusculus xianensis]MBF0404458.1 hypothetical protein [Nitrospirota bacterium]